jgi:hypothetical protein
VISKRTQRMRWLIASVVIASSVSTYAVTAIEQLRSNAGVLWKSGSYAKYADTWRAIDALEPTFASAFNIALGTFRAGNNSESLRLVGQLQARSTLSAEQRTRSEELRVDILVEMRFVMTARERYTGSATLSSRGVRNAPPVNRENNNRRGFDDYLGFTDDQIEKMKAERNRTMLIANGYDAPVIHNSIQPEKEP